MEELDEAKKKIIVLKMLMAKTKIQDAEGNDITVDKCYIDTNGIKGLNEFVDEELIQSGKVDPERLKEHFVVPVFTPDGKRIEVEVDNSGPGILAEMERIEGKDEPIFLLEEQMKEFIPEGLENVVGMEAFMKTFHPKDFNELAENLTRNGKLLPNSKSEAVKMASKDGLLKSLENEKGSGELSKEEQIEKDKKEIKESSEIPQEAKDELLKICEENGLDISKLKQVLEVPPKAVSENGHNTGVRDNEGKVTILRFRDARLTDRVIAVQNGRALEQTGNEERFTQLMKDKTSKEAKSLDEDDSEVIYTDLNGNTIVEDLVKSPNDLTPHEKEDFNRQWEELEKEKEKILNSDSYTFEEKEIEFAKISQKKQDLQAAYNIYLPNIEDEILEDKEEIKEQRENIDDDEEEDKGRSYEHEFPEEHEFPNPNKYHY